MTETSLESLDGRHVDVAIVGAGINGASAAQHLAAAGYRVLAVDQGDFADGATSRSSRLLHCGLRHLATGSNVWSYLLRPDRFARALGIVGADMAARDEIVRTSPHRLRSFNFCLPIYSDDPYAPWQLDAAFTLLRLMSHKGVPLEYRRYRSSDLEAVPIIPWLRDPGRLRSVAVFREYQFDWAERIALDALFDARRMGAEIRNYTRVEKLERAGGGGWRLTLAPTPVSQSADGLPSARVTADLVLNLAGAWVDRVILKSAIAARPKCVGLKGIHIAVHLPEPFAGWGLFAYNTIGEPLYCLPWRGMHYIGPTRTPFKDDATRVAATDEEIDWIIGETNRCFPKLEIGRSDVLFTWAGVQPVTYDAEDPKGNREIKIHDLEADGLPGIFTLTGGPIMTHRHVARRLVVTVGKRRAPSGRPREPNFEPLDPEADGNTPPMASAAAVERSAQNEQPRNLADLLMRRLGVGWETDQGLALARPVAEAAAPHLGWSAGRIDAEVAAYKALLLSERRRPGDPEETADG